MTLRSSGDAQLNADVSWAAFDPIAYVDHNYRDLQAEDAEILSIVRDHFGEHFRKRAVGPVSGIDVGAGANLYPALAMLPWCDEVTLYERSSANVRYLRSQVDSFDGNWDQFWRVLCKNDAYAALDIDPRARFREVVKVRPGDLFDLVRHEGEWSLGTMFFVAESMTSSHEEFRRGVECFLRALAPGAPFAAAFMEHSKGYHAGEHFFPACDVGESEVYASLERFADDFKTTRLKSSAAVRDGYSGMIVAYGRRNSDSGIPPVGR
ncbi:SCO2525 family SAM-dependent methyltransferase [Streptomyces sp. TRM68416]|uniref:SCO2525 family SAM-dependent methyltransferase n=1 Tax=Streptomyces sp. TRM68416 TaxID=2758412 RepID=UPI001661E084|nr:SCO2525 family SAM-dependent methyltransferase [Streptomyces sp. TRM68416]MBD0837574.1 methyltransferase [Streptomyces sp. TRM68416]